MTSLKFGDRVMVRKLFDAPRPRGFEWRLVGATVVKAFPLENMVHLRTDEGSLLECVPAEHLEADDGHHG